MVEIGDYFRPGQEVPDSGIYNVAHDGEHSPRHQVIALRGDRFPRCRVFGDAVRFRLVHLAPAVDGHDLFADS